MESTKDCPCQANAYADRNNFPMCNCFRCPSRTPAQAFEQQIHWHSNNFQNSCQICPNNANVHTALSRQFGSKNPTNIQNSNIPYFLGNQNSSCWFQHDTNAKWNTVHRPSRLQYLARRIAEHTWRLLVIAAQTGARFWWQMRTGLFQISMLILWQQTLRIYGLENELMVAN